MEKAMVRVPAEKLHSCWRSERRGVGAPAAKKNAPKTAASPAKEERGESTRAKIYVSLDRTV
jgi:hypothetical protein